MTELDAEVRSLLPPAHFSRRGFDKMRAAPKAAGKPSEIVLYDGMPHGFHADYRPSYREAAAKDGRQRLRTWFQQNGAA
jgi:carboxymethylenebutenolidase